MPKLKQLPITGRLAQGKQIDGISERALVASLATQKLLACIVDTHNFAGELERTTVICALLRSQEDSRCSRRA